MRQYNSEAAHSATKLTVRAPARRTCMDKRGGLLRRRASSA
jgi:hypothetical protein